MAKLKLDQIKQIKQEIYDWKFGGGLTSELLAAKQTLASRYAVINANPIYKGAEGEKARLKEYGRVFGRIVGTQSILEDKRIRVKNSLKSAVDEVLGAELPKPSGTQQQLFDSAALELKIATRTATSASQLFKAVDNLLEVVGDSVQLCRQVDIDAILDGYSRVNDSKLANNNKSTNLANLNRVLSRLQEGRYTPEQHEAKALLDNAVFFEQPLYVKGLHENVISEQTQLAGADLRLGGTNAKLALEKPKVYGMFLDALQQDMFAGYVAGRKNGRISETEVARSSELQQYEDVIMISDGRKSIDIGTSEVTEQ